MTKWKKPLEEWAARGLISPDQAERIHAYESAKPESSWIMSGLLILGALTVGIGVVSLIAANWSQIPDGVKLGADFLLLAAVAWAILQSKEAKKELQFDALLLFFLVLCLASIGLISQVYHTGGKLYLATLFWSLITFTAAFAANLMFIPFVWVGTFVISLIFFALDSPTLLPLFHKNFQAVFMAAPLLCAAAAGCIHTFTREEVPVRAFRHWVLLSGMAALAAAETRGNHSFLSTLSMSSYFPGYVLAAIFAVTLALSREYKKPQKILLASALGLYLISFHWAIWVGRYALVSAGLSVSILALIAVYLASQGERRLFQWLLIAIGLRFLILYFQAFGGLATTGIGLILSGALVIGMAALWNKFKTPLAAWAERWAQ